MDFKYNMIFKSIKDLDFEEYEYKDIRFGKKLGNGANGEVYKCKIKSKNFAIKRIFTDWIQTREDIKNFNKDFYDELFVCSKMKNFKRIMQVYGVCFNKDDIYIICELLDNKGCLHNFINSQYLGYNDRLQIFKSILLAVKQLHRNNIVHGDLKVENMVYYYDSSESKDYVKLIDFNTSYIINDNDKYDIPFLHGTYGYCAIEQHRGKIHKKSDIYSLGVILLELIINDDLWDINCYNYQKYRKSILNNLDDVKDERLKKIIKKCISISIDKRYGINELYYEFNKIIK